MSKCRLIYKSTASLDVLEPEALKQLVEQSARNNEPKKITGMLLLLGDQFLQVLEGNARSVNRLYRKILVDERHRDPELISFEAIPAPVFQEWSMEILDLNDLPSSPRKYLRAKYENDEEGQIVVPRTLPVIHSLLFDARSIRLGMG